MKFFALAAFVAVMVLGCGPGRRAAAPPVTYRTASPEELLGAYNANAERITSLSAKLTMLMLYEANGQPRRQRISAWLDVQKPASLNLRHDAIGRELFYIVSDGERFWIGLDRAVAGKDDVVYTGEFGAITRESFLRPDRLLAAFSLAPLPPADTADTVFDPSGDTYAFLFIDGCSPRRIMSKAFFSRVDLMLHRYQVFDEEGRLALDIEYMSYANVDGILVPDTIHISWPLDRFAVEASVRDMKINVPIPSQRWVFRWRPDAEVIEVTKPSAEGQEPQEPVSDPEPAQEPPMAGAQPSDDVETLDIESTDPAVGALKLYTPAQPAPTQ